MKKLLEPALILIFIVSGCSNYSNIPRQRNFFLSKTDVRTEIETKKKPVLEIGVLNKDEILIEPDFNLLVEAPFKNDSFRIKTKVESNNSCINREKISLLPPNLNKNIIKKPDSIIHKSRTAYLRRRQFPPALIMLGAVLAVIGMIFGIGFISEKRNGNLPAVPPEKPHIAKTKPKRNLFAYSSSILSIISWIILIASLTILLLIGFNLAAFIFAIFTLFLSATLAFVAIILGVIALYQTKSEQPDDKKNRIVAISGVALGVLMLLLFIALAGPGLI